MKGETQLPSKSSDYVGQGGPGVREAVCRGLPWREKHSRDWRGRMSRNKNSEN